MKTSKYPDPIVVRPRLKNGDLKAKLTKLAEAKNTNLNNYAETLFLNHVRRMAINEDTK